MNDWGNNPATYEAISSVVTAVGVLAVFGSTILGWFALRETKAQREALEREMAVRMRPWVGLFGFGFEPRKCASNAKDELRILLRNFGSLPAQRANLSLLIHPVKIAENEPDNTIRRHEAGIKTLVPQEEGNYRIDLSQYPQFTVWRESRRDVRVEGTFRYGLDSHDFLTTFEATIWFSESPKENDANVRTNWRNKEAV